VSIRHAKYKSRHVFLAAQVLKIDIKCLPAIFSKKMYTKNLTDGIFLQKVFTYVAEKNYDELNLKIINST